MISSPAAHLEAQRDFAFAAMMRPDCVRLIKFPISMAFTDAASRYIVQAIDRLDGEGEAVTDRAVIETLQNTPAGDRSALEVIGGISGFAKLVENASPNSAAYPGYHLEVIEREYQKRLALDQATAIRQRIEAGDDPVEVLAASAETFAAAASDIGNERQERFPVISSASLATTEISIRYLIEGVIVQGQPHVWGGPAKGMKTSSALDAAISMATGGHFLGYFPAKQASGVLFLSGESGLATLKETAARICDAAGRRLEDLDRLHWCISLPRLDSDADLRDLRLVMKRLACDVLFIDPLYLCLPGDDAGNMFAMGGMLRKLSATMEEIDATTILLHHTTRAATKDNFEPLELSSLAWSGISEFARAWVLVNRAERYEEGTGLHRLNLVTGGSAGHSGGWQVIIEEGTRQDIGGRVWRTQVLKRDEARQAHERRAEDAKTRSQLGKAERDLERLLIAASQCPDGTTERDLMARSGLRAAQFRTVLAFAIERDQLASCDVRRANGQVYPGYKLPLRRTDDECANTAPAHCTAHSAPANPIGVRALHCVSGDVGSMQNGMESWRSEKEGLFDGQ